jgi:iron complex transport system substrate-binding protein
MFATIELIGTIVNERQKAMQWIQELRTEMDKVREQASRLSWRPSVYFEEWMDPLYCGTGWISDLIEIAGGNDVFQERSRLGRNVADRTVTVQDVVQAAPQIVLASWCGKPFDRSSFEKRFGDATLPAITTGSIFALEATILQCGPMLIDALHSLHKIFSQFVLNHEFM